MAAVKSYEPSAAVRLATIRNNHAYLCREAAHDPMRRLEADNADVGDLLVMLDAAMAELATARSFRLASPSQAVDPSVHTPERVFAYLTARGWTRRPKERGLWDSADQGDTVFVHAVATASDYQSRTGLLVSDLAAIYGTGELQVLADIAETEADDA